jgi:Tat protein secretion system quality control protein TatD with DNase activity
MKITCSACNETKPESAFGKDSRNRTGRNGQCYQCRNEKQKQKVKCKRCNKSVNRQCLKRHQKSSSCTTVVHPWQKFKSTGKNYIKCPCKHPQCKKYVTEATAYRHLKYLIPRTAELIAEIGIDEYNRRREENRLRRQRILAERDI